MQSEVGTIKLERVNCSVCSGVICKSMAGNTFTQAFIIHRVVANTKSAKSLLFLLDEHEKHVICKIQKYGHQTIYEQSF